MERYYDGDQEALFKAAHVINPYIKPKRESKVIAGRVECLHRQGEKAMSTTFTRTDAMRSSCEYLRTFSFSSKNCFRETRKVFPRLQGNFLVIFHLILELPRVNDGGL